MSDQPSQPSKSSSSWWWSLTLFLITCGNCVDINRLKGDIDSVRYRSVPHDHSKADVEDVSALNRRVFELTQRTFALERRVRACEERDGVVPWYVPWRAPEPAHGGTTP